MHKQSFAECHSLATKAPLARPSMHFSSKIPEVSKKNSRMLHIREWVSFFFGFRLKPQEFKQKTPGISIVNPWGLFSYNPDYTINAATSAKIA